MCDENWLCVLLSDLLFFIVAGVVLWFFGLLLDEGWNKPYHPIG